MTFAVLFVCTGNICRSPMAELLARSLLDGRLGASASQVVVASAGTWGHEGSHMEPEAVQALAQCGIDGQHFRARELTHDMVCAADLVLTATREHAVAAVALAPESAGKVFAMTEFARLLRGVDSAELPGDVPSTGRALTAAAAAARRQDGQRGADADLADPYGAPLRVFSRTAAQIQSLLEPLVDMLAATTSATPGSSPIARVGMQRP